MTPSSSINHLDCQPRGTNCYCEFVMFKKVGVFKMFFSYHLSYLTIPIISPLPKFTFSSVSHDLNSKFHYAKYKGLMFWKINYLMFFKLPETKNPTKLHCTVDGRSSSINGQLKTVFLKGQNEQENCQSF